MRVRFLVFIFHFHNLRLFVCKNVFTIYKMHYIFSVEGNIGSGKSTLVKMLKNTFQNVKNTTVVYLPEPVSVWESITDNIWSV